MIGWAVGNNSHGIHSSMHRWGAKTTKAAFSRRLTMSEIQRVSTEGES